MEKWAVKVRKKERRKVISMRKGGVMDSKDPGFCAMTKKVSFGVPREKVSGKSGNIKKADARSKDCPKIMC